MHLGAPTEEQVGVRGSREPVHLELDAGHQLRRIDHALQTPAHRRVGRQRALGGYGPLSSLYISMAVDPADSTSSGALTPRRIINTTQIPTQSHEATNVSKSQPQMAKR